MARFGQDIIDLLRGKKKLKSNVKIYGLGNEVIAPKDSKLYIEVYGDNNQVFIPNPSTEEGGRSFTGRVQVGTPDCLVKNCIVRVGKKTGAFRVEVLLLEDESEVIIGSDCMLSSGVSLTCTDTHSILDKEGNLLNKGKFIRLGDHVWVGADVKILKNVTIASGCVVGTRSLVSKEFKIPNCVIAGVPAKVVKTDIRWDVKRPNLYIKN
ncbi:hypothetical protein BKH43_02350 [Helicobacter sp. 13S00401-1]|uniref:acyltransferase n=1 Tax=Helicobacter sp. 13S00401-1 TaxID=1905758 RepID=UPI000BA6C1D2|nr:acyltransferase [Helicobacter sp. 13S00401-1]PAF51071.1 hypothetical protein BKH43_02350 [Helicobacter sp. 13S00401-1]